MRLPSGRSLPIQRRTNPLSLGGLDRAKLDRLKGCLEARDGATDRERLDRLLMRLQLNDLADVHRVVIRGGLITDDGRPVGLRRA